MSFSVILGLGALGLGAIFGSFLNALSFRFNTGRGIWRAMQGRSHCMHCGHTLGALDLVPIVSWLMLRGRCRYCGEPISAQYPLVEAGAALLSLGAFLCAPSPLGYALLLFIWLDVLFIVVYDLRHMIIPWSASLSLLCAAVLFAMLVPGDILPHALAGIGLALPLFLLSLVSWGRWMGWADSLFELSLGMLLGVTMGATALVLAVWLGAGIGLMLLALKRLLAWRSSTGRGTTGFRGGMRGLTIQSEIPFAPFLALGAALAFFLHVDFFSTLPLLF